MISKIIKAYNKADKNTLKHGKTWYRDARIFCELLSEKYNVPVFKVAGIVAATSINCAWKQNTKDADKALEGTFRGLPVVHDKIDRILKANNSYEILSILNGNKIKSFYLNIYHPKSRAVTIDRWAMRVVDFDKSLTNKQYKIITKAYQDAALKLNVLPAQVQAVTWGVVRGDLK